MALNDPRTIPFDFRVFEAYGVAWLYDDSVTSYVCSQIKQCYCEPLYHIGHEDNELPEAGYFTRRDVEARERHTVEIDENTPDLPDQQAWDDAREEANANCRI